MLKNEHVLAWCEVERDLYEEDGHVFGVELDLFNNHKYFYHREGNSYIYLDDFGDDIYRAIEKFNHIVSDNNEECLRNGHCPICNLTIEERTKHSIIGCPKCGHHIVMSKEE